MLEAHRIRQRTEYDLEMMKELGFCNGIENYSRILDGRPAGSAPHTLLDYFPTDYVVFIDESHQTVPQIGGMYEGDRSRKQTLVDFGFRLPSALDNRPLRFDEFLAKVPQIVFVSATPGAYELRHSTRIAEQLIRPTGVVDPEVELRPTKNQIDDLLGEIRKREAGRRARARHDADEEDVGGPDRLPARVRREGALPPLGDRHARADPDHPRAAARRVRRARRRQPAPRGARPAGGLARRDPRRRQGGLPPRRARRSSRRSAARRATSTGACSCTPTSRPRRSRRRSTRRTAAATIQLAYNEEHGITPLSITKGVSDIAEFLSLESPHVPSRRRRGSKKVEGMSREELEKLVVTLEEEMLVAAEELRFEYAAKLRDEIKDLRRELNAHSGGEGLTMCRSIKTLYNVEPAASEDEVRAAALQFVRKISGYRKPSQANEEAFERAVDEIAAISLAAARRARDALRRASAGARARVARR